VPFYKDTYEDWMQLAGYYDALGEPAKAVGYYEKALKHAPRGFDANFLYATLLQRMADAEEDPEIAKTHRERAVESLELVLTSNPDSKDAQLALQAIQAAMGAETDDGAAQDTP
jgi:cytochrome c-type biogenesis protein CcmH/NrfG